MIDPIITTTVRVGQLPPAPFELTDKLPHEIEDTLFQGTVLQLAEVISDYIGTTSSLAFNPTTVNDGGTLPVTNTKEWILVGTGTFHNVGGATDIITTEELNALTSNGTYWGLAVEIPINVELAGITQNIRSGYAQTTPSEDAVYKSLAKKVNITDLPPAPASRIIRKQFLADGISSSYNVETESLATMVFWGGVPLNINDWAQSGSTIIITAFIPELNVLIQII